MKETENKLFNNEVTEVIVLHPEQEQSATDEKVFW